MLQLKMIIPLTLAVMCVQSWAEQSQDEWLRQEVVKRYDCWYGDDRNTDYAEFNVLKPDSCGSTICVVKVNCELKPSYRDQNWAQETGFTVACKTGRGDLCPQYPKDCMSDPSLTNVVRSRASEGTFKDEIGVVK